MIKSTESFVSKIKGMFFKKRIAIMFAFIAIIELIRVWLDVEQSIFIGFLSGLGAHLVANRILLSAEERDEQWHEILRILNDHWANEGWVNVMLLVNTRGTAIGTQMISLLVKEAGALLNYDALTPSCVRHSVVFYMLETGHDDRAIMYMMGLSSSSLDTYKSRLGEGIRDKCRALEF